MLQATSDKRFTGVDRKVQRVVIPNLGADGFLPLGRYPTDLTEFAARFVSDPAYAASQTRTQIWADFDVAAAWLRRTMPVCSVWIGGSFVTSKTDPADLDVTWIVHRGDFERVRSDAKTAQMIERFARSKLKPKVSIDSYMMAYEAIPQPDMSDHVQKRYWIPRGHWDDWWQRVRQTAEGLDPTPLDAAPRRGYLEVILDGYRKAD